MGLLNTTPPECPKVEPEFNTGGRHGGGWGLETSDFDRIVAVIATQELRNANKKIIFGIHDLGHKVPFYCNVTTQSDGTANNGIKCRGETAVASSGWVDGWDG